MSVWPFSLNLNRNRTRAKAQSGQPVDSAAALLVGMHTTPEWPEDNYEAYAREGYGRQELVFACVSEIATSAAEARLRVVTVDRDGTQQEDSASPLAALLARPNPQQSQFEFLELLHTYLQIAGNAYVFKLRSGPGGRVTALHLLRPDRVRVWPGADGLRGYIYTLDGVEHHLLPGDIGHIRRPNPFSDWYGLSPLHVIARIANVDSALTAYTKVFFQNAGVPSGLLNLKRKLQSQDEASRIRAAWRAQFGGAAQNWHRLAILDEDASYQQIAIDLDHMAMPDLRNITESRICAAFGVPPILVGANVGLQRSTFANYAEARRSFWDETLAPEYRRVVDAFNLFLAPEFTGGGRIEADFSQVRALQDDADQRATRVAMLFEKGIVTLNEARTELGYDSIDGGIGPFVRMPAAVTPVDPTAVFVPAVPATAPHALPAPDAAKWLPLAPQVKALSPRAVALLTVLEREREAMTARTAPEVAAYFRRVRSRLDGMLGRAMQRHTPDAKVLEADLPKVEDIVPPDADADLARVLRAAHLLAIEGTWNAVNESGLLGLIPFDGGTPPVQAIVQEGATRVVQINDATRAAIRRTLQEGLARGYNLTQITQGVPEDGYPGLRSVVEELYRNRATTIARTEIGTAQNAAAAARYAASGVTRVIVMDGEEHEPCAALNGTYQSIEWFRANPLAHPNCVRAAAPSVDIPVRQEVPA